MSFLGEVYNFKRYMVLKTYVPLIKRQWNGDQNEKFEI